jgi:PAS domain S-box-containing protein
LEKFFQRLENGFLRSTAGGVKRYFSAMYASFSKVVSALLVLFLSGSVFPASACQIELTAQEQAWLDDHSNVVHFVFHPDSMPVEFLNKGDQPAGMMIDFIRWIAEQAGFTPEFSAEAQDVKEHLLAGKYDAASSFWYGAHWTNDFSSTPVLFELPISIFVASESPISTRNDLNGKTVVVSPNDKILENAGIRCIPLIQEEVESQLMSVLSGRADALVGIDQVVLYSAYNLGVGNRVKRIDKPLFTGRSCIAVAATNPVLGSILSKGVAEADKEGLASRLQRQWIGPDYNTLGARMFRYMHYVIVGTGILLAAVLLFWIWDVRLFRRVLEKTEALRNSEERLRTIFQNSPDAILIEDEKGAVLDANPVACAFHQMSHSELVGKNALDLVPAAQRDDVKRDFSKWFTGELKRHEGVSQAGDGREVPVEVIGAPLRFDGARAVLLMMRDMTDRRQVEKALKESEMRYRGLIEAQSNFIVRTDTDGQYTFVNEAFCRFIGRARGELLGNDSRSYACYDDIAIPEKATEALISRRERVVVVEHRMRTPARIAWVQWENIAVFDEAGRVVEIQSVGHDITERRRIYEALQESEKRLRFLFEEIPHIAVQGYNAGREAIFWNRASEELYKFSKKEALGKKYEDLVLPIDRREEMVSAFDRWAETGTPMASGEMLKRDSSGRLVAVYSSRLATRNQRGEWEVYVIDVDLSELKRANEELVKAKEYAEKASRAKSEFLANMSHEIRTPMNGVMGMTHLLLDTELTPEQRDNIQTIMDSTTELLRIIDELLDISRIEAGEVRLHPEPFCPRETVEKVILLFADRAGRKGVDLSVAIHDSVPQQMLGDSGRIRQILINLVGNALKFTHDGHIQLRMQAEPVESGWNLIADVKDTGIGMTPELQERIFEKFTQGDTSSKREYGGTGLGLAITRQLVGLMGGKISVASEVDKGTTFQFNLKLGRIECGEPAAAEPQPQSVEEPKIKAEILLVEDNLVNQKVATAMLKKLGCNVIVVPNGARALEQIALRRFNLIFMDCQMPIMDGFEATRAIRQMVGEIRDIPIVAMTAHALKEDRQKCLDAGMDDYLAKPVHRDRLVEVLRRAHVSSVGVFSCEELAPSPVAVERP